MSIAVVLIAAFVLSTLFVEHNSTQLDAAVAQIVDNAAPSIGELAAARSEMRHLELGATRYISARSAGVQLDRGQLLQRRNAVDEHLHAYAGMPFFEGERELYGQLYAAKLRFYDDIDHVIELVDRGQLSEARALSLGALDSDAEALDAATARLIVFNNGHAAASARDIAAQRHRTRTLALLLDTSSVLLGAVLLFAAIRSARLYHRALDERRRLAELRVAELDHFAARVAHDLKAPLASVVLGTSVATEHPEETTRALVRIQRASRLMGEMIDALLAVARVEPERNHSSATTVASVLDVVVEEVRPSAESAGASVRVEPFSASVTVACSPGVLASVLSNLLQNAVKYIGGAAGERAIVVRVAERGRATRIEVADSGPGLPRELEEHVFERYVKGSTSSGLGLGLATVKRLVDSVGGRLGVSSSPGHGSCFWVELPSGQAPRERIAG